MSVGVYVNAIKELSGGELRLIKTYNTLAENRLTIPDDLKAMLMNSVGESPPGGWGEPYGLRTGIVEFPIMGRGDVMSLDGMVIEVDSFPAGTKALRIFAE